MGCYLAIGLKIKTAIGKKEISKHLDEMPLEDIFKEIEKEYHLEDIYVRQETEDYYVYTLDEKLLDKEFIPFLEKFYQLRYQDGNNYDAPDVLEELNSIPNTSIYSRNKEKGGLVTTISASFNNSIHSCERKSPVFKIDNTFLSLFKRY